MHPTEQTSAIRERLNAVLTHPVKLRVSIAVGLMLLWFLAVYQPLAARIEAASRRVQQERKRLDLGKEVEHLKREEARVRRLLPGEDDRDAWSQYLMAGLRRFPLRLLSLDPQPPADVGPYKAVALRLVVEGTFGDLERFLRWLETCDRLVRIDSLRLETSDADKTRPSLDSSGCQMQLVVMAIVG